MNNTERIARLAEWLVDNYSEGISWEKMSAADRYDWMDDVERLMPFLSSLGCVWLSEEQEEVKHPCQVCLYYRSGKDKDGRYGTCTIMFGCSGIKHWRLEAGFRKIEGV